MNFSDQGIILSKKPLKERNYIVTVLTKEHGVYSGVLRQGSKKTGDNFAPGNLVDFNWNARLHEHIGMLKLELIKSYNAYFIMNKTKLYAFNSSVALIKCAFIERAPHNELFPIMLDFVQSLKQDFDIKKYFDLELAILAESGYKLQLNRCVVSGALDNLCYVSPKSGCAVSAEKGKPYAEKLLKLPKALYDGRYKDKYDIIDSFKLTTYFLDRYILDGKRIAQERKVFEDHIVNNLDIVPC